MGLPNREAAMFLRTFFNFASLAAIAAGATADPPSCDITVDDLEVDYPMDP
jgi:hypothetical protein